MSNYVLTLQWTRCPDGAEFIPHKRKKGGVIRYRSDRREPYSRRLEAAEDLIAAEFLNTALHDDGRYVDLGARIKFVDQHGLPHETRPGEIDLRDLLNVRQQLDEIWRAYEGGDLTGAVAEFRGAAGQVFTWRDPHGELRKWQSDFYQGISGIQPDIQFRDGRPVLTLPISTLFGFMLMETGLVITGGSQVLRCENCSVIFVTGPGTGRRNTSRYCSNRCRVAAQRASK